MKQWPSFHLFVQEVQVSQGLCLKVQQKRGVRGQRGQFLRSADNQAQVWSRSEGVKSRGRSWCLVFHLDAAGEVRETDPDPTPHDHPVTSLLWPWSISVFFQSSSSDTFAAVFCLYVTVKKVKVNFLCQMQLYMHDSSETTVLPEPQCSNEE